MKKIVALVAIAAIAGGMIFAQPEFEPSVTLDGSATVKWGVDLDAGQTGFENATSGDFKVKLWGDGSRELEESDGIWAELKVTGKEAKINKGTLEGGAWELNEAKIHINDFYIGIKSGDTQVGEYKFDGAIRSADNDSAKWLTNVGPEDFSQGITLGYGNDNFGIDADLRSYYYDGDKKTKTNTHYTSAYAFALEGQLKDSNEWVEGLGVKAGVAYNFSNNYFYHPADSGETFDAYFGFEDPTPAEPAAEETDAVTAAQKAFDENPSDATYDALEEAKKAKAKEDALKAAAPAAARAGKAKREDVTKVNTLGYAFQASYKLAIDDTYYLKPALGLTGALVSAKGKDYSASALSNKIVVGALFGWGENKDDNAGVYFLNGDGAKKVTPGISVVAAIPLPTTASATANSKTKTATINDTVTALIVPSVYLGDALVEGLKFAAYSEIALLRWADKPVETSGDNATYTLNCADKDRTFALAFAMGVGYDIAVDEITVTPKAGLRYANTAYNENAINKIAPLSNEALFNTGWEAKTDKKMGLGQDPKDKKGDDQNFFNLKIGCDVAGLIPNTTFFVEYSSANLMNDQKYEAKNEYDENIKFYNSKLGTFDVGAKISF